MDGKQVAILVPTTVLAEQHYLSFQERFQEFPATIEVLSRFRTRCPAKESWRITQRSGGYRHRYPPFAVQGCSFKDLGLLIIDEEHRFGVAQRKRSRPSKSWWMF